MKKITLALMALLFIATSCSNDPDDSPGPNSRVVTYEVTGNFTGVVTATYYTASGGITTVQLPSIPWTKEIAYGPSVSSATIGLSGNGGVVGQKVTLLVKRGGVPVGPPTDFPAIDPGAFSGAGPVVLF